MKKRTIIAMLIISLLLLTLVGCKVDKKTTTEEVTSSPAQTVVSEAFNTVVESTEVPSTEPEAEKATNVPHEETQPPQEKEPETTLNPNLVLVIGSAPKDAELLESTTNHNGTYVEKLLVDGILTLTIKGLVPENKDLETKILAEYPDATDISINESADSVASYPTQRASFTTGSKEDTNSHVYLYIATDAKDFTFDAAVPVDSIVDYQELIEDWISTLDIFDGSVTN